MKTHPFKDRRPTELEEQAYADARQHFAEHLKQFPGSRDALRLFEQNLPVTAARLNLAASQSPPGELIQAGDGAQWRKVANLSDYHSACCRPTSIGTEFAIVEQFPNITNEAITRGTDAKEVLQSFAQEQRQALQLWAEDMAAQFKEFLAEKHPDQDMSRVADAFMIKSATHKFSERQAIAVGQQCKRGYRMGV